MNLWKKGKVETQRYYDLKLKRSTDIKSLIFGLIITLVVISPFLLILIQFFKVYFYHPTIRLVLFAIAWVLLMICNGLSNYFMVKLAKAYYPENPNLLNIDEKAIMVYQTFNVGFAIFTIALVIFLGVL
jgi:hypothetical protein